MLIHLKHEQVRRLIGEEGRGIFHPFLMVDTARVDRSARVIVARKVVSCNDTIYEDGPGGRRIFPALLMAEVAAQAAALLEVVLDADQADARGYVLGAIDQIEFKRDVVPGETLAVRVVEIRRLGGSLRVHWEGAVNRHGVASGVLTLVKADLGAVAGLLTRE